MSEFETAKELAQHIANIAPRGAVVSYVNNQVTVRLSQQANLHELQATIVRSDEAFPTPRVEIDDKGRLNVYRSESEPVKAAQAETGADESAASFRPEAPSINSLSHRLDVHRILIRELRATAKEEREEREAVVKNLVQSFDRLDEHVDDALDAVHDKLERTTQTLDDALTAVERTVMKLGKDFTGLDEHVDDALDAVHERLDHLASQRSEDSHASLVRRVEDLERAVLDPVEAFAPSALDQAAPLPIPNSAAPDPHYPHIDTSKSWEPEVVVNDGEIYGTLAMRPLARHDRVEWKDYANQLEHLIYKLQKSLDGHKAALRVARYDGEMQSEMKRGGN